MKWSNFRYRISPILVFAAMLFTNAYAQDAKPEVVVYKSPTCGCCTSWVRYIEDNGYKVETHDVVSMDEIKAKLGLTDERLKSCHTALVDGYIVEGHVPVSDIERLLVDKPQIKGLTAPGMPLHSPGMASIEPKDYDVYSFDEQGNMQVFSRY